ncbi:MAG: DUF3060 domain-containing protein [Myxococcales bacterium]|nr:DUF3060 domain-containing protein [Myxococcales bacterium]
MTRFALALVLALVPAVALADAPDHVINNSAKTVTVACGDGGRVVVNGSTNVVTVTGGCAKVVVNGSSNTVAIDAADKIAITGSSNKVTYKKGHTRKAPKITQLGSGNQVARVK